MNKTLLTLGLEFLFILITAVVVVGVLYPIITVVEDYRFLIPNICFIIVLITCTRYIFLLKHTFLGKLQYLKTALVFASLYGMFLLIDQLSKFQAFVDNEGSEGLIGLSIPQEQAANLTKYIHSEMLFFGMGAVIAVFFFAIRMIISLWRFQNKGGI